MSRTRRYCQRLQLSRLLLRRRRASRSRGRSWTFGKNMKLTFIRTLLCAINCQAHDIPILVAARLLRPLGNPPPNGTKYFSTAEVLELVKDRSWLAKITNTVCQHWQKKNSRRKGGAVGPLSRDSMTPLLVAAGGGS